MSMVWPAARPRTTTPVVQVAVDYRWKRWQWLLVLLVAAAPCRANADDVTPASPAPALQLDAGVAKLVIVTDDDFLTAESRLWCSAALDKVLRRCREVRTGMSLQVHSLAAGAPLILTKNRPKTGPRRVLILLCDSADHVFGFCVGVPTAKQLLTLIEDADEHALAAALRPPQESDNAETEQEDVVVQAQRKLAASRTLRHYRPLIETIHQDLEIAVASERLSPALQRDLAERFLLTPPIDYPRLVAIQQHAEAYRYWCDAMLPCVIGKTVDQVWPELAEVVWGAKPWQAEPAGSQLVAWYCGAISTGAVVLEVVDEVNYLDLPTATKRQPDRQAKSKDAAVQQQADRDEPEAALGDVEHRIVDVAAFAVLLDHRREPAIDLFYGPLTLTPWVLIESDSAKPQLFHPHAKDRFFAALDRVRRQNAP